MTKRADRVVEKLERLHANVPDKREDTDRVRVTLTDIEKAYKEASGE